MTVWNSEAAGNDVRELSTQLTAVQREELLRLARAAMTAYLQTGHIPDNETADPALNQCAGVFVTLRMRKLPDDQAQSVWATLPGARLRGCVGRVEADRPLYRVVPETAVKAATRDPRFPSLTAAELDNISIEISILSPLRPLADIQQIEIGAHGLMIEDDGRRGLLLPEVPVTRGWGREEFLQNLCRKAGLPLDCWRGKATLYTFTTVVFGDAAMH